MNTVKNELRQKYRALRDSFGEEFIKRASDTACKNLVESQEFINADALLLYYPIKNEISPLPLLELCLKEGKKVAFPVCNKENSTLIFRRITALEDLTLSTFNIFEPNENCDKIKIGKNTLCIVPALIFSRDGHRIGYGKGYYDRFLANFEGVSVGFSYSALVCDEIQHESHDIPLDLIVTESEVLKIASKN